MTERQKLTLEAKIQRLREFISSLKGLQKTVDRKRFFSEEMIQRTVERLMQLALESSLDIGNHIINEKKLRAFTLYFCKSLTGIFGVITAEV